MYTDHNKWMYSVIIHEAFQGVEARGDMALKTGDNPLKTGGKNCDSSNSFFFSSENDINSQYIFFKTFSIYDLIGFTWTRKYQSIELNKKF